MNENLKAQYRIETDMTDSYRDRYFSRKKSRNHYSIKNKTTNEIVASGNANECAEQLSITIRSFYDLVSRAKKGLDSRYVVVVEK